jgi:hypothetical protein
MNPRRIQGLLGGTIYLTRRDDPRHLCWVNHSTSCGGSDQGEFSENSVRPKPQGAPICLVLSWRNPRAGINHEPEALMGKGDPDSLRGRPRKRLVQSSEEKSADQVDTRNWAMEVYCEQGQDTRLDGEDDDILEFNLDEEEAEMAQKFLEIAIYYSLSS